MALSIDLYDEAVVSGTPLAADLLLRNTTRRTITLDECTEGSIGIGLVPAEDPAAAVRPGVMIDCYDTPRSTIPPGSTIRVAPYGGLGAPILYTRS